MVNQNENQNEFVLVLGPYNQNGLRFVLQEKVTKMNFIFVFVLGYHKDQPKWQSRDSNPNQERSVVLVTPTAFSRVLARRALFRATPAAAPQIVWRQFEAKNANRVFCSRNKE